ncbi:MAG: MarR family transcriptional regulator [Clostridia bacterium]|nr:MarR family transcriptional regulator [Clostridia bacterium]
MNYEKCTAKLIKLYLVTKLFSSEQFNALGVHFSQVPILDYIYSHPDCTQVEVADALSVTPASIALSTKRLEKAGFITKATDANNLRRKKLSLTDKGRLACMKGISIREEQDARMYSDFTEEEFELLGSFLDRITMNLTKEEENTVERSVIGNLEKQIEDMLKK